MFRYLLPAILWVAPAMATEPNCFFGFGGLSDDPVERERAIGKTYRELLETLGADRLSRATLESMLAESPLRVPESETETIALRRRLQEFEEMLAKKGWNNPETIEKLKGELAVYRQAIGQQKVRLRRALSAEMKDFDIKFPVNISPPELLPGGRWAYALSDEPVPGRPQESSYVVYDIEKNLVHHLPRPKNFKRQIFVSPHGPSVFFEGTDSFHLREVPFSDGQLQWSKASEVLIGRDNVDFKKMKATDVPGEYLADLAAPRIGFLTMASDRGGYHSTIIPNTTEQGPVTGYGWVPGKPQFYYTLTSPQGHFLQLVDRNSIHDMKMAESPRPLPQQSSTIGWSFDGSRIIATEGKSNRMMTIYVAPSSPGGAFEAIKSFGGDEFFPGAIVKVLPYPDRNAAVAILRMADGKYMAEYIDLEQKISLKRIGLPAGFSPSAVVTADAAALLYQSTSGNLRTLNLDREFPF